MSFGKDKIATMNDDQIKKLLKVIFVDNYDEHVATLDKRWRQNASNKSKFDFETKDLKQKSDI